MLREIVLDTETTGTDPAGDRIVEIGCLELLNYIPTGRTYHVYINPQRAMSQGAYAVHGLSDSFLADKPVFPAIAPDFMEFVRDARLVIHNAAFDVGFLNAELGRCGHPTFHPDRAACTLTLARRKHPGAPASLDALCSRYGIDNSRRTKHGALLDAEILAEVYIELMGGRQADLGLAIARNTPRRGDGAIVLPTQARRPPVSRLTDADREAHLAFVTTLGANALWRVYLKDG
jgi:DNA polymerase-3 subunit epsilon